MDLSMAKRELKTLVQSMLDEGILNIQFMKLQDLQDESNPNFVAEVVTLFLNDAQKIIADLGHYISQKDVNFAEMEPYIHQIKGSSSSIGARHMTIACGDLLKAAQVKDKEMCLQALQKIGSEYLNLQGKLCTIVQLENTIFSIESNQKLHGGRFGDMSSQRR